MTRAVVFLAVALATTALGTVAQGGSGSPYRNGAQPPLMTAVGSAQNPASHDANSSMATSGSENDVQKPAQTGESSSDVNNSQLPQTSTILPLLGLLGLGSLVAGLFARR